jgi:hypothetical protein
MDERIPDSPRDPEHRITNEPPGPERLGDQPLWERPGGFRLDGEPYRRRSVPVAMLGPLVVALAGFGWGRYLETWSAIWVTPIRLAFLAGGLLGLVGLVSSSATGGQRRLERLAAASLLAYVVLAGVVEPLAFVGDITGLLFSVALLSPLIVGGVLLPGRGCWWTGLGCWSVLFSGTAALGYNFSHAWSGRGFLIRWVSRGDSGLSRNEPYPPAGLRNCSFPAAGLYWVEFLESDEVKAAQALTVTS